MGCELEPRERTHVYLFLWASRNAELAIKLEEPVIRRARGDAGLSWEETFVGPEEEWKRGGMVAKSVHLETHHFP